jgi:hypothetical protein
LNERIFGIEIRTIMKKLLLSLSLIPAFSFAQITLNETHFPDPSEQFILSTLIDPSVDYLSTGQNYTWDFSTLTPTGQRATYYYDPEDASFLAGIMFGSFAPAAYQATSYSPTTDLPLADLTAALPVTLDGISQFTKKSSSAVNLVGFEFLISGQGIGVRSDTIEQRYPLPLNYGDTWETRGYTDLDMNPIYNARWIQHRHRVSEVDGWGTITTPYGTYDALRIRHFIQETDSLYVSFDSLATWIPIPVPDAYEYEWRAVEEKEPVFRVRTSVILGNETPTAMEYRDDYNGLGLEEPQLTVAVYPNPVFGQLFVKASSKMNVLQIMNQQGQVVQTLHPSSTMAFTDLSGLEAGLYYAVVTTDTGVQTTRIVKE